MPDPLPTSSGVSRPPASRRRFSFRVTRSGYYYLAAAAFILVATVNSASNLLYLVFGLTIGALFVSLLFSSMCLRNIKITRSSGRHLVAGEPADFQYTVSNPRRFFPALAICFHETADPLAPSLLDPPPGGYILYLPRKSSVSLSAPFVPRRRGHLQLSTIRLSCTFPFGFIECIAERTLPEDLVVYPRIGMLNRQLALQYRESIETGTMTSNVRGGNDEFYGLREYRPGDNVRAIHWRSTARTRQLMIREMSANAPPQLIVVLNLRQGRPRENSPDGPVERAIELAASLICYGFFENFAVGLAIAGMPAPAASDDVAGRVAPAVEAFAQPGLDLPAPQMGREARAAILKRLAELDPARIRPDLGILHPNRLAGRAEWIVVTLHASDPCRDLLPAFAGGISVGPPRSGHHTILPLDSPDAPSWLHFLSTRETQRLLHTQPAPDLQ